MTAVTAARATTSSKLGHIFEIPVQASATIYAGTMVMIDSGGYAQAPGSSVNCTGCPGVALTTKDNSSGSAGLLKVLVQEGEYLFVATSITQAMLGEVMYGTDNQTFDDADAGNRPKCGLLTKYVSTTSGRILMSWANMRLS